MPSGAGNQPLSVNSLAGSMTVTSDATTKGKQNIGGYQGICWSVGNSPLLRITPCRQQSGATSVTAQKKFSRQL